MSELTPSRAWTCAQFEAALSDYREGTLATDTAAQARTHVMQCMACSDLVAAVASAQAQCAALPALAPPPRLLGNILAQTMPARSGFRHGGRAWPARSSSWARAWSSIRTPRFALGFAMSVFAVALLLNAAQVNLGQVFTPQGWQQLSPASMGSALTRRAGRAWARGVAYYHDLRVVYEIEAAIHQMRQSTPPAAGGAAGHNRSQGGGNTPAGELAETMLPPAAWRAPWRAQ